MKDLEKTIDLLNVKDPTAISQLYDAYSGALLGVIIRIVQDRDVAEEVLHDTFIRAWQHGSSYDSKKGSVFTWLMQIARRLSINKLKSKAIKKKRSTDELNDQAMELPSSPNQIQAIGLAGHVANLENKYQELIELIYFKGYTHKEAAEALNLPLGTLKSRVKNGLNQLRRIYLPG